MKLYYSEDGKLLYSRIWPDVPEVKSSIYQDVAAMNLYNRELKFLTDPVRRVEVVNHDHAMCCIILANDTPIERENFYDIKEDAKIFTKNGRYYCEIQ